MNSIYYLLPLISGAALTLQVGINGKLRSNLGSPVLTSLISFAAGSIGLAIAFAVAVLCCVQTIPAVENMKQTHWWMWLGGLFGAFYIFTTILASPKISFGNMFCLLGYL